MRVESPTPDSFDLQGARNNQSVRDRGGVARGAHAAMYFRGRRLCIIRARTRKEKTGEGGRVTREAELSNERLAAPRKSSCQDEVLTTREGRRLTWQHRERVERGLSPLCLDFTVPGEGPRHRTGRGVSVRSPWRTDRGVLDRRAARSSEEWTRLPEGESSPSTRDSSRWRSACERSPRARAPCGLHDAVRSAIHQE